MNGSLLFFRRLGGLAAKNTRHLGVLLLVAAACAPPAKHETAALAAAVDRFRRADNASKADLAATTAAVPCTDPAVCAAKDACVAAMGPTARALVLKDDVARKLDDIEHGKLSADSPEAKSLAAKLDEAEKLLAEGRAKWSSCERSLGELRIQYGV
jgi:hypothetical protein